MAKEKQNNKTLPLIIGITGTTGAGKGTLVEYLVKEKRYEPHSVRNFLKEHLVLDALRRKEKPKKDYTREEYQQKANYLRGNHSNTYVVEQLYYRALRDKKPAVIESLRAIDEIKFVQENNGYVFSIDAPIELRYHRIRSRKSSTDHIGYDTFLAQDKKEWKNKDISKQNIKKCMELSDFHFYNDKAPENLYETVDRELKRIIKNYNK